MARTPSMSCAECEAILGPRGPLRVDAKNRPLVKKWLVASGYPALFVGGLSMFELAMAYNDNPDWRTKLDRKLAEAREAGDGADGEDDNDDDNADAPSPDYGQDENNAIARAAQADLDRLPPAPSAQAVAVPANLAQAMSVLQELFGNKNPLSEKEIRDIARHEAAQVAPRPLHVTIDDKPAVKIEGHVSPQFDRVLKLVAGGANVLLVGPAGCGKTHMAEQIAKALGATYGAIHGSAGASESALTGWLLPGEGGAFEYVPSPFVTLYEQGESLFLCDELDAFDANMLIVANGALANGHMYIAHRKHAPCVTRGKNARIMATANTYGTGANPMYAGRAPLDTATLDRFVIVTVDYDKKLEEQIGMAGGLDVSEMAELWALRDRVRDNSLRRVISTRAFQKACIMKQAGDKWPVVKSTLVEGWSRDERAKVGM